MIAWGLILEAGAVTAAAVACVAIMARWSRAALVIATFGTFAAIVGWRAIANAAHLNGDFVPLISGGDVGCLPAGALVPAVTSFGFGLRRAPMFPAIAGGIVGFAINVVIL